MGKEVIQIGDIEIERHKFHPYKNSIFFFFLKDMYIDNIYI